jgi:enoyl-CoA hydratase
MEMTKYKYITSALEGGILYVTVNREDKMNVLNRATLEEIRAVMQEVYDEEEIKGAIITGAGDKAFIAGADINEIAELNEVNGRKFSEIGQEVFNMIETCDKPVIAAINGYALGGGCELAMACHLRVATKNAKFGLPEVKLGLLPGFGGTQRLPQLVGKGKALEMMMTADMISAQDAKECGLINHLVEDKEELLSYTKNLLEKIIQKAPHTIGKIIDCVNNKYQKNKNG